MAVRIRKNKVRIDDFRKEVTETLKQELLTTANRIESGYKAGVPVDTGALKNDIHVLGRDEGLGYSIGSNKEYAPYVEFGTGGLVDVPEGLESYAIQFKGAGIREVNLPARPALFPVARVEVTKLITKLKKK